MKCHTVTVSLRSKRSFGRHPTPCRSRGPATRSPQGRRVAERESAERQYFTNCINRLYDSFSNTPTVTPTRRKHRLRITPLASFLVYLIGVCRPTGLRQRQCRVC